MSAKLMGQVWDLDLPHGELWVLMAICDHADHDGNNAHPGLSLLEYKTDYSRRQLQRIITALETKQIITQTSGGIGRGQTQTYKIKLENAPTKKRTRSHLKEDTKDDTVTPIKKIKGDILHTEKVTFNGLKGDISTRAYKEYNHEPSEEPCEPPSPDFFEEIKSLIIAATGEPPVNGNLLRIEQAAVKITQSAGQTALPDLKSFIADQGSKIIKLAFIAGDFCSWNAARRRKAEPEKPKREYTGLTWATMTEEQRASFRN